MESNKYEKFIKMLNFNPKKYKTEKVFMDFISLYAINLSNRVTKNIDNETRYKEISKEYTKEDKFYFYALAAELTKIFYNETEPYDILGDIYQKITGNNFFKLINNTSSSKLTEVKKKVQGIMNINKKNNTGRMVEINCGSGAMILAYASTLKIFKLNYKLDLNVTAVDTNLMNIFMTYIQLYFYNISAVVIWVDENNKELMRLYTPSYEYATENLIAA